MQVFNETQFYLLSLRLTLKLGFHFLCPLFVFSCKKKKYMCMTDWNSGRSTHGFGSRDVLLEANCLLP